MIATLESLDAELFQPLVDEEASMLLGGGSFTFVGFTNMSGQIERDHEWDEPPAV